MLVILSSSLSHLDSCSGATDTMDIIINEGKVEEFESLIGDLYPYGITLEDLNDILWHDSDWVFETLGIEGDQ